MMLLQALCLYLSVFLQSSATTITELQEAWSPEKRHRETLRREDEKVKLEINNLEISRSDQNRWCPRRRGSYLQRPKLPRWVISINPALQDDISLSATSTVFPSNERIGQRLSAQRRGQDWQEMLADQDVCFTQLGDNFLGTILLLGHDLPPFQPVSFGFPSWTLFGPVASKTFSNVDIPVTQVATQSLEK